MGMPYIILIIFMALALALQLLTGCFPVSFFSFPLNLILAFIWLSSMLWIWKSRKKSMFVEFMLSPGASVIAVILFLIFSLVIGFSGKRDLASTWVFVAMIFYFQTVLLFVILRGWRAPTVTGARLGSVRWRFVLNHAGLLLAVSSAFWGAPDSETYRLKAYYDTPVKEAYAFDGRSHWLPYEIVLTDFRMEEYADGTPSMFEASVLVDGKPVTLQVNDPYSRSLGEDIYLASYDVYAGADSRYCILQIVREPWKYSAVAGVFMMLAGALMMFAGGPRRRYGEDE